MLDDGLEERRTRAVKVEFQDWMDAAQTCLRRALDVAHECDGADADLVLDILNRVAFALGKCSVVAPGRGR